MWLHVELFIFAGIVPDTHSPGMFSWFPILFPVRVSIFKPVALRKDKIVYNFGLSECNRVNLARRDALCRVKHPKFFMADKVLVLSS